MDKCRKITPDGFRDFLFEESEAKNEIEKRLMSLFKERGFREVWTPALEFLDVFTIPDSSMETEQIYKLIDSRGRLMALRPDITMPIARLVATRLKDAMLPLRLCYTEQVYRVSAQMSGRRDEVTQSGVELIGASGKRADLEIISLATEALQCCEVDDFKIEIGHAGFFKALTSSLSLKSETTEEIRRLIESKNYAALDDLIQSIPSCKETEILKRLPRLFGGKEVLEEALEICGGLCRDELSYLKEVYEDLSALGLKDKIYVDLGLVHRNTYYTGLLFRGYISGSGITVLSGGRYDHLLNKFGKEMPAVGFAVEADDLSKAFLKNSAKTDILVFGKKGFEMKAILLAKELSAQGMICENSIFETREETIEYAKKNQIKSVREVGEVIIETEI